MRPPHVLAALFASVLVATPLGAQITEKKAVAEFKAGAKANLKTFKQAGKDAVAALDAALDDFDATLDSGPSTVEAVNTAGNALVAFTSAMNSAYSDAFYGTLGAAETALNDLANGGSLGGLYPDDFYFGTGGAVDDARAALDKESGKVLAAARKRADKSLGKAESVAGLAFTLLLRLPTRELATELDQGGVLNGVIQGPTLDVVLTVSAIGVADDGLMFVSGSTEDNGDVTLRRAHAFDDASIVVPPTDGRFTVMFNNLAEGGWAASATQGTGPETSMASIGVR